ncbi:MAG: hypothetical protein IPK31_22415 [Chitinophagaceae bacterium]|nr:hypothetical protein [Chitinophagaceae bacterium]
MHKHLRISAGVYQAFVLSVGHSFRQFVPVSPLAFSGRRQGFFNCVPSPGIKVYNALRWSLVFIPVGQFFSITSFRGSAFFFDGKLPAYRVPTL